MDPRLFEAACSGDVTAFHSLLAEDPLILNRVSLNSVENPLHVACLAGQINITHEIVSRKPAFARELNEHGFNPMHIASANGHAEIVRELLRVGYDICLLKGKDGKIPLHCAAMKGRVDVVKELVSACPEAVKEVTDCCETVLHVAVKSNQLEAVKILLEQIKRLDMMEIVNWKDKNGNTMLHLATFRKQHETIAMLIGQNAIAAGLDINSTNSSGFTPKDILDYIIQSEGVFHEIDMLEMFQHAGVMIAREITTTNPTFPQIQATNLNKNPTLPPSSTWNLWKGLMKEIEESSTDTQNALMVVAVLIATVTYQATLSPPSGFWSGESRKSQIVSVQKRGAVVGEAVMADDPQVFTVFTIFNAIGFSASLCMISLLTSEFPLRAGLRLAMLSMAATYVIAVIYMGPTSMRTVVVVIGLTGLLVLIEFVRFMIWLLEKWGILACTRTKRKILCQWKSA